MKACGWIPVTTRQHTKSAPIRHYFAGRQTALCNKAACFPYDKPIETEDDHALNCANCQKKRKATK